MRKTKIIATIGPASSGEVILKHLLQEGIDAVRINFSHGTHSSHAEIIRRVRQISGALGRFIPVIGDLQGPKPRIGAMDREIRVTKGDTVFVVPETVSRGSDEIPVDYPGVLDEVSPGDRILINDGKVVLRVGEIVHGRVKCTVESSGIIQTNKGINFPDTQVSMPSLTDKDRSDTDFAVEHDLDYLALSFVRSADDVNTLKEYLISKGAGIPVIAKLEKQEAMDNCDEILQSADAVMIARGDLGVEISPERVPGYQKTIIRKANANGLVSITATQMLESMITSITPTRAEVSDVANAVFDGTDAVMLSGETAIGGHPLETVSTMRKIIENAELSREYIRADHRLFSSRFPTSDAIAHAAVVAATDMGVESIIAFSQSGTTMKLLAKYRPVSRIIGASSDSRTLRQAGLLWGVTPVKIEETSGTDEMIADIERKLLQLNMAKPGETVVITAGTPVAEPGTTNTLKIQNISDSHH